MKWHRIGWQYEVLCDENGKVCGTVRGEWRTWAAHHSCGPVGDYLTNEQAKRAVERALMLTEACPDA